MDDFNAEVRTEFVRIVDGLVVRLRDSTPASAAERSLPRRVTNLGHRLSDTLSTDLADELEALLDELLTLAQPMWPDGSMEMPSPHDAGERLALLSRRWTRLKRNLLLD
jgi:hypothetical protein